LVVKVESGCVAATKRRWVRPGMEEEVGGSGLSAASLRRRGGGNDLEWRRRLVEKVGSRCAAMTKRRWYKADKDLHSGGERRGWFLWNGRGGFPYHRVYYYQYDN